MKAFQKLTLLGLLGTFAFGQTTLTGSIDPVHNLSVTFQSSSVTSGTTLVDPTFSITVENNYVDGYMVQVKSLNLSKLINTSSVANIALDGNNITYTIACDDLKSNGVTYATGVDDLTLTANAFYSLLTPNLNAPTPAASTTCTIDIDDTETYSELYSGSYEDTLTIQMSSITNS